MPRRAASPRSAAGRRSPAQRLPVARVAVDVPLAHLDHPFDYLVPERLDETAVPGCRVRVRFAGQLADGYLLERRDVSDHGGRLAYLERAVSPEPVLTPQLAGLAREIADRYGGTLADVLRLAIPPRHGEAEKAGPAVMSPARPPRPAPGPWVRYPAGEAYLAALTAGKAPRAVWTALPGQDWPQEIAVAAATAAAAGRGALIVVPDARDLRLVDTALLAVLGPGHHVSLAAGLGPAERYRRWLAISRGAIRVVAGTRAAMFAPVADLGLTVIWDDGDDLHAEPRAPYPHAREVLALRAHRAGAGALVGGFTRTAEGSSLVAAGWAAAISADRSTVRRHAPAIAVAGDDAELARDPVARSARMPSVALRAAREGLARGPVLVQVPRRGYVSAVACERCRAPARCAACGGPLALAAGGEAARCRWCGAGGPGWRCPECGHGRFRAVITGAGRTAEELARAFPGTQVITSGGPATIPEVAPDRAVVVATPGAEPTVPGGYAAAVLLDGWVLLGRPSLRAAEEALRRWLNAAALVRPASDGGVAVVVADASARPVQALIRWDPSTHADRELAERAELRFPPAVRMAALTGAAPAVADLVAAARLPDGAQILGPIPVATPARRRSQPLAGGPPPGFPPGDEPGEQVRTLVRVPRSAGLALASALQAAQAVRSSRKAAGPVRVQLDPAEVI